MPKTREQKKEIIEKLQDKLQKMKSMVFVDFTGLKAKEIEELRRNTKKHEGDTKEHELEYLVAKKTLIGFAVKAAQEKGLNFQGVKAENLQGEIALMFGYEDEIAPMRLIENFSREHQALKIRGGILDNKFIDSAQVITLAKLPSRQELLAKIVGSIQAPLTGLVGVLQGNLRGLLQVLSQYKNIKV